MLPAKFVAVPACGRVTPRAEEQTEETEETETNEQNNNQTETPRESNSYEHADEAIVGTRELKRALKAARREKYEQAAAVHRDVQRRFIMEMAEKSQSNFDNTFLWEEGKVMAARASWARSVADMEANETPVGAVGIRQSWLAGEAAAGVDYTMVQSYGKRS